MVGLIKTENSDWSIGPTTAKDIKGGLVAIMGNLYS